MAKKKVEKTKLEISVPEKTANTEILKSLIAGKKDLICHAFDIRDCDIVVKDGKITFPWFDCEQGSDEANAYMMFVSALCRLSMKLKRTNSTENDVPNEKYAFRCFLLRLGFIGDEYKAARKVLLKNLSGSAAFKSKEDA